MNKPSVSAGVVAGVALGAAALGAAAVAVRAACLQVARTRNGLARVKRVHDEGGDEIRVLVQGGVYQSASYVGERWAEPVFAYYRAFDDVFEAEDAMRDAGETDQRIICDYISGMTDQYAITKFSEYFMPQAWQVDGY